MFGLLTTSVVLKVTGMFQSKLFGSLDVPCSLAIIHRHIIDVVGGPGEMGRVRERESTSLRWCRSGRHRERPFDTRGTRCCTQRSRDKTGSGIGIARFQQKILFVSYIVINVY